MTARRALLAGLALAAAALLAILAAPTEALRAWLAAAVLWSGLPLGSLGLALTMRLTGGRWDRALPPFLEAGALTLPLAFAAMLPVLLGLGALYPWVGRFQDAWLAPVPFALRTLILFLGAGAMLWALAARRGRAVAVAAAGLLFLLPMQTLVLTDWLLSLEPGFHSSGFPLYAMSGQFNLAFMAAAALLLSRQPRHTAALGAIMIALTLTWLYLAFTHYIVIWSGDLAPLVGWYRERLGSLWGAAYALCAAIETGVLLALLVPWIRRSATALRAIAGAAILARVVEAAWLVLPAAGPMQAGPLLLYLLAAGGLGLVFLSAQALILDCRIAARSPA